MSILIFVSSTQHFTFSSLQITHNWFSENIILSYFMDPLRKCSKVILKFCLRFFIFQGEGHQLSGFRILFLNVDFKLRHQSTFLRVFEQPEA